MSTEQLKERLMTVFGACAESSPDTTNPPLASQSPPHNTILDYREPSPGEEQTIDAPADSRNLAIQSLLAERGVRLQAKKRAADAQEKARNSEAKARRGTAEGEAASAPVGSKKAGELVYAQQQRRRVQEAKEERARVLRLVEHDKAERKERVQRERELLRVPTESANEVVSGENKPPSSSGCAMRIRLLDGSTIQLDFPSDATLRTNVRPRIEGQGLNSDLPYTFKHIRVPLPNRAITISQEDERICDLDLTPNANLVLVPVEEYSTAYVGGGSVFNSGLAMGYSLVSSGVEAISGVFGRALGLGQPAPPNENEPPTIPSVQPGMEQAQRREEGSSNVCNIRRLHDRRPGQGNQQLYNGNQVSGRRLNDSDYEANRTKVEFRA